MFLSQLKLNPRDKRVRNDLSNRYSLHQTLMRVTPKRPNVGNAFPGSAEILFRLEYQADVPTLLVQTLGEPNWSSLGAGYLIDLPAPPKDLRQIELANGQRLRFRLFANPTKRLGKSADDPRMIGRRVGLRGEEAKLNWLQRKAEQGGFRLASVTVAREDVVPPFAIQESHAENLHAWKPRGNDKSKMTFEAVQFDGVLEVVQPIQLQQTLAAGIGSAKAFGFGLLSLGRA